VEAARTGEATMMNCAAITDVIIRKFISWGNMRRNENENSFSACFNINERNDRCLNIPWAETEIFADKVEAENPIGIMLSYFHSAKYYNKNNK
jgi:hypothetical protein